jgi:LmbE family N-acetylglucosaminyl deacetylase
MADFPHKASGYVRRGMLLVAAVFVLGVILFGGFQWKTYRRNLQVSDANLSPFPALSKNDRILILSPHPDDETLGAGGLMAKAAGLGVPVRVVFLTNGDGSLATRLVQDAHFVEQMAKGQNPKRPRNIYQQIAPMRQKEALAALAKLHVPHHNVTFLGYPDGGTKNMWETNWDANNPFFSPYTKINHSPYANSLTPNAPYCGRQALMDVEQIVAGFKPTIVITTNPYDTHPDHWAAYAYLSAAVAQLQLQQKYFSWAGKIKSYTFIVHHGLWPAPHGYHPDAELSPPAALMQIGSSWLKLQLDANDEKAKTAALQQYRSQLATTPQFLRGFLRRNELFAPEKAADAHDDSWQQVIQDTRNDLLLPKLIAAADVASVSVENTGGKVLLARINLDGDPWKEITYEIVLHVVTAHEVSLRKIIVSADSKGKWRGVAASGWNGKNANTIAVKVEVSQSQLTIELPVKNSADRSSAIYMISTASRLHERALDQSPTGIIQFHSNS